MSQLDVISAKKAAEVLGICASEMREIKAEMKRQGYHVVKDGRITWMKPSEIERYLLTERSKR